MHKLLLAALFLSAGVQATELDPSTAVIPQEIIVREDAQGNREVFKVSEKIGVSDAASAAQVIENFVTNENKVVVIPKDELDQTSSTEAWYFWYNYNYSYSYNYSYNYYGHNYYYQPYYNYNYGYYNYSYYRCW